MATRNDLAIIKQARTGAAAAQLALGTRYFLAEVASRKVPRQLSIGLNAPPGRDCKMHG